MPVVVTFEITGVLATVVNVKFAEVAERPPEVADTTS
jgi:hypothetical protein